MPRNPKVMALMRADIAQANYKAADKALTATKEARKRAMMACLDAGCTLAETGAKFNVTGQYVANVRAELRINRAG